MINEKAFYEAIAQRLRERRRSLSLTQEEVTSRLGMERTSLAHIESARHKPSLWQCVLLCRELDISLEQLLPPESEWEAAAENPEHLAEELGVEIVGASGLMTPGLSAFLRGAHAADKPEISEGERK